MIQFQTLLFLFSQLNLLLLFDFSWLQQFVTMLIASFCSDYMFNSLMCPFGLKPITKQKHFNFMWTASCDEKSLLLTPNLLAESCQCSQWCQVGLWVALRDLMFSVRLAPLPCSVSNLKAHLSYPARLCEKCLSQVRLHTLTPIWSNRVSESKMKSVLDNRITESLAG